ncbi:MAG: cupin domain-containing protein [Burkholderiales bacterium]
MDLVADILSTLSLSTSVYFRAEFTAPFAVAVPEEQRVIRFHAVSAGSPWLGIPTGESAWLNAGDLVIVPHGRAHVIAHSPEAQPEPLADVIRSTRFDGSGPLVFGGGGAKSVMVCGHFAFAHEMLHPIITSLPPLIHVVGRGATRFAWLEELLAYISEETRTRGTGWQEVVQRLSEVLFICVLREHMGRSPHSTGALTAIADPRIGDALQAIHADPAARWSVDTLAERAAMSKTVFAERFRHLVGVTPARYVVLWRMLKARSLLEKSELQASAVASRVGYASEAAFNRVFKAYFGAPPGRYRRTHGDKSG